MAKMYGGFRPEIQNSGGRSKRAQRNREEVQAMKDTDWEELEPTEDDLREVELLDEDELPIDDDEPRW